MNRSEKTREVQQYIKQLPTDLRLFWEERAGIRQFDGGLARQRAEAAALQDLLELYPDALADQTEG